jgi:hypothetical protein
MSDWIFIALCACVRKFTRLRRVDSDKCPTVCCMLLLLILLSCAQRLPTYYCYSFVERLARHFGSHSPPWRRSNSRLVMGSEPVSDEQIKKILDGFHMYPHKLTVVFPWVTFFQFNYFKKRWVESIFCWSSWWELRPVFRQTLLWVLVGMLSSHDRGHSYVKIV